MPRRPSRSALVLFAVAATQSGSTAAAQSAPTCPDEPNGLPAQSFSIAILPDTQHYAITGDYLPAEVGKPTEDPDFAAAMADKRRHYAGLGVYAQQTEWIAACRDKYNIRFVAHVGDMTQHNTPGEWVVASDAHRKLDDAGIPYNVAIGNHDIAEPLKATADQYGLSLRRSQLGSEFPPTWPGRVAAFTPVSWDTNVSRNENTYYTFNAVVGAKTHKFLVLSLEYIPRKDAVAWANQVVFQHQDHHVIVITHAHLNKCGGYYGGMPEKYFDGRGPEDLWKELLRRHANIFMVLSGHYNGSAYRYRSDTRHNNAVHEILTDFQSERAELVGDTAEVFIPDEDEEDEICNDSCDPSVETKCKGGYLFGNGWMRLLTFVPDGSDRFDVRVKTFSVAPWVTSRFPKAAYPGPTEPAANATATDKENWDKMWTQWYADDCEDETIPGTCHTERGWYDINDLQVRKGVGTLPPDYVSDVVFRDRMANVELDVELTRANPRVAAAPNGDFVVVWEDHRGPLTDIRVRGYDRRGDPLFDETVVNEGPLGPHLQPDVAMRADGAFVVVWADDSNENGKFQIRMRGLRATNGVLSDVIGEDDVNAFDDGNQINPAIALSATGNFVVVWEDDRGTPGVYQIVGRGFSSAGVPDVSPGFTQRTINAVATGQQLNPAIDVAGNGTFVVAWEDDRNMDERSDVFAARFSATGTKTIADFRASRNATLGDYQAPAVGAAKDSFVIAWADDDDGNQRYNVIARRYPNTSAGSAEIAVNTSLTCQQKNPALAIQELGTYVVVWDDGCNGALDIKGRKFSGTTGGEVFTLNSDPGGNKGLPAVALDEKGAMITTWQNDMDEDGDFLVMVRNRAL